ncbi:LysR substrate-binding domain-containing protein [Azospirillum sp. CT11-132]|uniref:LysR substrate-binding domain-containing protein n=1 Tax=Azospirillum sp. CT11-132 TaxID=3396317 RepID=UPI0039A65EFC
MNLRQLEAFRLVVSTGTTVAAARILNLTQPAVSKLITEFQKSMGIPLFRRENGRLIPTNEGMALFAEVGKAFASLEAITEFANRARDVKTGNVNVIIMPSLAYNFAARVIANVSPLFPGYLFDVGFGEAASYGLERLEDKADLVLLLMPAHLPGVDVFPLVDVRCVCVVPRGHRLTNRSTIDVSDLDGESLVLINPLYHWRQKLEEVFARAGVKPIVRAQTTSSAHACGLAAQGVGIALVNELMANEINFQTAVIRPFTPTLWQTVALAVSKNKPKSDVLVALIDAFRSVAREYS